jgi:peptidoglycan-associated lipoprotein
MRAILIAALLAVLAGCASAPTTPQQQAPASVEDRSPGQPGVQTQGIGSNQISGVDLTAQKQGATTAAGGKSPLTDPSNILSHRSIYYDFDQYDIKDEYRPLIEAHAAYLRAHPDAKILIQGNTDERGSREYNVALGQRRADGVKRMLLLLGVKEDQVEAVSLGEEKPKALGTTEEAYAQNRRCDILYKGEY